MPVQAPFAPMGTITGNRPAVDADGCIVGIGYKVPVVSKAANYSVLPSESGTHFVNTAAVTYTLPAVATSIGCEYWFAPIADFGCTVSAPAGTLVAFNNTAATSIALSNATTIMGGIIHVVCTGTKWLSSVEVGNILQVITVA
jgi:hypothetical protein